MSDARIVTSTQAENFNSNLFEEPARLLELMNYIWQEFKNIQKKDNVVRAILLEKLTSEDMPVFNASGNSAKIIKKKDKFYLLIENTDIKITPKEMEIFWRAMQGQDLSPALPENKSTTSQTEEPARQAVVPQIKPQITIPVPDEKPSTIWVETTFHDENDEGLTKQDIRQINKNDVYALFFNGDMPIWANISAATSSFQIQEILTRNTPRSAKKKPQVNTLNLKAHLSSCDAERSSNLDKVTINTALENQVESTSVIPEKKDSSPVVDFANVTPAPVMPERVSLSSNSMNMMTDHDWQDMQVELVRRNAICGQDLQRPSPVQSENKLQAVENANVSEFLNWLRIQLSAMSAYIKENGLNPNVGVVGQVNAILSDQSYTNEAKIENAIQTFLSNFRVTNWQQDIKSNKFFSNIKNQQLKDRFSQYHEACMITCLLQVVDSYCKVESCLLPKELREKLTKKIHEKIPMIESTKVTRLNYPTLDQSLKQSPRIIIKTSRQPGRILA